MTHQELIAALEKLSGPSREADARIHVALGETGFESHWRFETFRDNIADWSANDEIAHVCKNYAIPAYTASIDAAMTLVPEGWRGGMSWGEPDGPSVCLGKYKQVAPQDVEARTLPLALCIATLKAIVAENGSEK